MTEFVTELESVTKSVTQLESVTEFVTEFRFVTESVTDLEIRDQFFRRCPPFPSPFGFPSPSSPLHLPSLSLDYVL